ncbi:MAG: PDZ domain-containing protein [Akkermansiaceae bacterium]|jgi:S1-C subfamily serine protease
MKRFLLLPFFLQVLPAKTEDSLVRINSTIQSYSASQPWEKSPPRSRRGLGTLLGGQKILTTAAMAADAIYLELESADGTQNTPAKVAAIDYEANLALLVPANDPGFLTSLTATELAPSPKPGDALTILQLESNGDPLATTGTIQRMDLLSTFVDSSFFLAYNVKGSLQTSGNSDTLPAFYKDKLAGIVTGYNSRDQISEVVAVDIIKAFLDDAADGKYDGFPSLGISATSTEDPHFRGWLKLPDDAGGLYLTRILPGGSADKAGLKKGDVILKINDYEIDRRGYYKHPDYGTLYWTHLVRGGPATGDQISLAILRDGKPLTVKATLQKAPARLVPDYRYDEAPAFLIKGGLVFQELTRPYLKAFGKGNEWANRAPLNLLDVLGNPEDYEEGRNRVVILTRVVATEATIGYDRINSQIIKSVNGKPVADLPDLAAALSKAPESGIHTIETDQSPFQLFLEEAISDKVDAQFLQRGLPALQRLYEVKK